MDPKADTGFAAGAIPHRESEGGVGLVYGKPGNKEIHYRYEYGVSHIDAKRPGWPDEHIEDISNWPVIERLYDNPGS